MYPSFPFVAAWGIWLASWIVAALWSGPTARRAPLAETWRIDALIVGGAVLFIPRLARLIEVERIWVAPPGAAAVLALATAAGLAVTWWARLHLGRLWSGRVEVKEGHRLVDSGPYAIVRHPIYTGLLAATIATTLFIATAPAVAGCVMIVMGLRRKARLEERLLEETFGAPYADYRRRVPALLPFAPAD